MADLMGGPSAQSGSVGLLSVVADFDLIDTLPRRLQLDREGAQLELIRVRPHGSDGMWHRVLVARTPDGGQREATVENGVLSEYLTRKWEIFTPSYPGEGGNYVVPSVLI